jgi:hypothetical protein
MDRTYEEILREVTSRRMRSRLDPYAELIVELKIRGWSYRGIAEILSEKCDLQVSYRTVHHYAKRLNRSDASRTAAQTAMVPPRGLAPEHVNAKVGTPVSPTARPDEFAFDASVPLTLLRRRDSVG